MSIIKKKRVGFIMILRNQLRYVNGTHLRINVRESEDAACNSSR